ncbi:hypothetical protein ACFL3C_05515, partial [Patescibacteria group bacterium]
ENVQIEVYDGAVLLSWDVATDDVEVAGYKIYSGPEAVTAEGGEYSNDVIDSGDVIEYLVEGLENEEAVYFAITAYDAAGNESENYSNEVNGTPDPSYGDAPAAEHAAADEEAPTVSDASALDSATVQVVFSEAVVLPSEAPETAFTIIDNASSESLAVVSVEMDPDDVLGETVLLTTDPQEGGAEYILTAGIQLEDTAGNPIVSGTSDTAAFIGSTVEPGSDLTGDLPEDDLEAPTLVSAVSLGEDSVQVVFSEPVILDSDPETNFFVAEEADASNMLDILSVERDETGAVVTIETTPQETLVYTVIVTGVLDEAGNEIDDTANSDSFEGNAVMEEDVPADEEEPMEEENTGPELTPENVQNFVASMVSEFVVKLTWEIAEDAAIIDQVLYKSTDGGSSYDDGTSLGPDREELELTGLTPGINYFFKLTTKDIAGNESEGLIANIALPKTGMGVGLLVGASMGLAALRRRKK